MTFAYAQPEKESFCTVEFKYGEATDPDYARYTDWNEDYVGGYLSTPSISIKLPENAGTFDERTLNIEMPIDDFSYLASGGLKHSPIFVTLREITRALTGGPEALDLTPFKGRVVKCIRNYQGRSNRVLFQCLPIKSRIELPLALSANHHCPWTLFGRGCGLVESSFRRTGTLSLIDGKVVTTATPGITVAPAKYWHRGFIRFEGRIIAIRDWDLSDPTHLYLASQPPASWVGPTLTFVPGCDKTIETCRARYSNEEKFAGIGYAIPPYNPLLENPA